MSKTINTGQEYAIVVLDRGFVYVGEVRETKDHVFIEKGKNIRYWGTTKGLGQLVNEGPTAITELDYVGALRIPLRAVISIHPTKAILWN